MKQLQDAFYLGNLKLRNRICVPPMVVFGCSDENGQVSAQHLQHYEAIARGGAALVIVEATCVTREGRLGDTQLGLWEASQLEGMRRLAQTIHAQGAGCVVQLHHAGIVGIASEAFCPDAYVLEGNPPKTGVKMTQQDIRRIQQAFVQAAVWAQQAGFDGVELHGCHGYLISQFFNPTVNRREDEWGAHPERFVLEIVEEIRRQVPSEFLVGIRLAAFEPSLQEGLSHARLLDEKVDFFDLSYGFGAPDLQLPPDIAVPEGMNELHAAAGVLRKAVHTPVFVVNGITTPAQAQLILQETDVDMVDVGRTVLVNPAWPAEALAWCKGQPVPAHCLHCPACRWSFGGAQCAGVRRAAKSRV